MPVASPLLHVVLHQPEIAANAGAIGRTCVAANAMLWLVRPLGFHLDDRHRKRAGLDYWEHLQWRAVDALEDVAAAPEVTRLWYFSTHATRPYTDATFAPGDALVFGAESRGLPKSILDAHPSRVLRIPMHPAARSLNLANASAIAVYEVLRQWSASGVLPYPS